jgi:hypothetical protein
MTVQSKSFLREPRCLLFPFAMVVLGMGWGCSGEVPPQAALDDAAKARIQDGQDAMKKARQKERAPRPFAGPNQK